MRTIVLQIYYKNIELIRECRLTLIDSEELCVIDITVKNQTTRYEADSFFQALVEIRQDLEKEGGIIQCNGSDRRVFLSQLQMAMGESKPICWNWVDKQEFRMYIISLIQTNLI